MSLSNIKKYFRKRLDLMGYREWQDTFNIDSIPETIIHKSYHIVLGDMDFGPINQSDQFSETAVNVRLFFKGYRNSNLAIDEAVEKVETMVKDICKIANRTSMLFNVECQRATINQLADSNDKSVFVELQFLAQVYIGVEE